MTDLYVGLFAGPGGWSEAMRVLGLREVGLEWSTAACQTRRAAGHATIQCDVAAYPVEPFTGKVKGATFSPPCTKFSAAGKGFGRLVLDLLADGIRRMMRGDDCRAELRERIYPIALAEQEKANAERKPEKRWAQTEVETAAGEDTFTTVLVLEPARYLHALITAQSPGQRLEWAALEQVREVLPLWQVYAAELLRLGWSVWCGILNAADYGVPQTRRRAILIASSVRKVTVPEPTHYDHRKGHQLWGMPWVAMAEVLGWNAGLTVNTRGDRKTPGGNDFPADGPSWALTEKARSWVLRHNCADRDRPRDPDTGRQIARSPETGEDFYLRFSTSNPSPALTTNTGRWAWERPATTVCATDRIAPPGHRDRSAGGESQFANPETVRITVEEASLLQSFRRDYPWHGSKSAKFLQIGNAMPPRLAVHVVSAATGLPVPSFEAVEVAA